MVFFKIIGIIAIVLVLLLIILLLTKIQVDCTYRFEGKEQQRTTILIKALFGLIRYKIEIPSKNTKVEKGKEELTIQSESGKEEELSVLKPVRWIMSHIHELYKLLTTYLKKVQIIHFEWKSAIGTGDAASSAIASGAAWAFKGNVIGVLSRYFSLKVYPNLQVTPVFNQIVSQTFLRCMIQIRIGNAILAGLKLLKYWRKYAAKPVVSPISPGNESKSEDQSL